MAGSVSWLTVMMANMRDQVREILMDAITNSPLIKSILPFCHTFPGCGVSYPDRTKHVRFLSNLVIVVSFTYPNCSHFRIFCLRTSCKFDE